MPIIKTLDCYNCPIPEPDYDIGMNIKSSFSLTPFRKEAFMATFTTLSREVFGVFSRYCVTSHRTRFGEIVWHVADAERICELTGLPEIIRQASSREEAVKGLA